MQQQTITLTTDQIRMIRRIALDNMCYAAEASAMTQTYEADKIADVERARAHYLEAVQQYHAVCDLFGTAPYAVYSED